MLLFLNEPAVTGFGLLLIVGFMLAVFSFFIWYGNRPKWPVMQDQIMSQATTGYAWLRKSALYIALAAFLVIYPFTQFFAHFVARLLVGVPAQPTTDALGNVSGAAVAADQLAGGGVQLGTFLTKLWITIVFYLLFCSLPWLLQGLTHPAPTAWAKTNYKTDFDSLTAPDKFAAYGRLQYVNAAKIIGAALAAALLV